LTALKEEAQIYFYPSFFIVTLVAFVAFSMYQASSVAWCAQRLGALTVFFQVSLEWLLNFGLDIRPLDFLGFLGFLILAILSHFSQNKERRAK
jgi:hypothetical protein